MRWVFSYRRESAARAPSVARGSTTSREEAGLEIAAADVELAHVVYVVDAPGTQPRLQLVFRAERWQGESQLLEPDKCLGWDWWPLDALPEPMVAYARAAVTGIGAGRLYTELGWSRGDLRSPRPPLLS